MPQYRNNRTAANLIQARTKKTQRGKFSLALIINQVYDCLG
jgi:hypothetical protein